MKSILLFLSLSLTLLRAELTDTQVLAFLQKNTPEIYAELSALKKSDPEDYRDAMQEATAAATEHARLVKIGDNSAKAFLQMYALDYQAINEADKIVMSKDLAEKERAQEKLKTLIAESLEQWLIVEQARILRMENELTKIKNEMATVLADKNKVIAHDVEALMKECQLYQKNKKNNLKQP